MTSYGGPVVLELHSGRRLAAEAMLKRDDRADVWWGYLEVSEQWDDADAEAKYFVCHLDMEPFRIFFYPRLSDAVGNTWRCLVRSTAPPDL